MEKLRIKNCLRSIFLVILIFSSGIWVGRYLTLLMTKVPSSTVSDGSPTTEEKADYSSWKTHQETKHGFRLKYPRTLFTKQEGDKFIISRSNKFEKDEYAMNISFETLSNCELVIRKSEPWVATTLDLYSLEKKLNTKVMGFFAGDPPGGFYFIDIFLPNEECKTIRMSVYIHESDEPGYGGLHEDRNLFSAILSTINFVDNN